MTDGIHHPHDYRQGFCVDRRGCVDPRWCEEECSIDATNRWVASLPDRRAPAEIVAAALAALRRKIDIIFARTP